MGNKKPLLCLSVKAGKPAKKECKKFLVLFKSVLKLTISKTIGSFVFPEGPKNPFRGCLCKYNLLLSAKM